MLFIEINPLQICEYLFDCFGMYLQSSSDLRTSILLFWTAESRFIQELRCRIYCDFDIAIQFVGYIVLNHEDSQSLVCLLFDTLFFLALCLAVSLSF